MSKKTSQKEKLIEKDLEKGVESVESDIEEAEQKDSFDKWMACLMPPKRVYDTKCAHDMRTLYSYCFYFHTLVGIVSFWFMTFSVIMG